MGNLNLGMEKVDWKVGIMHFEIYLERVCKINSSTLRYSYGIII